MKNIVVASLNPVKIQAVLRGFQKVFPGQEFRIEPVSVPSGVAHQPLSDQEAYEGAANRQRSARLLRPDGDFWAGIEGGIEAGPLGVATFAWVVIGSKTACGKSRTGTFFLPEPVVKLIHAGKELGEADDIVFQRQNSKQESGAIGLLTGGVVNRLELYEQAVILALVTFRNPDLYPIGDL